MSRLAHCSAVGALALLSVTLSGCGGGDKALPPIGGFYANAKFKPDVGSFAGLRVISDVGAGAMETLAVIGCDDGDSFWDIRGKWTDKSKGEFSANFQHRGTEYPDAIGTLSDTGITWNVTNYSAWTTMGTPSFALQSVDISDPKKVGGLYTNAEYQNGTFAGTRMVAANYFPHLTFIGSDDGKTFWTIIGNWDDVAGQFRVDFTPVGGKNVTGTIGDGILKWSDLTFWQKRSVVSPDKIDEPETVAV